MHGPAHGFGRIGVFEHLAVQADHLARERKQGPAMVVENDNFSFAREKFAFEVVFQCAHLQSDSGLGQGDPMGRTGKRSFSRNSQEGPEETDAGHGAPLYDMHQNGNLLKVFLSLL
ncbi:hypothetical protein GCM10007242_15430 [Pigmentiphaga litoralis]|nr:hypothetical protein GCM10007242_15430 [Pigmentiphaga litoralis]